MTAKTSAGELADKLQSTLDRAGQEWGYYTLIAETIFFLRSAPPSVPGVERTAIGIKLAREVKASFSLFEPLARREMGNTNYNIIVELADAILALIEQRATWSCRNCGDPISYGVFCGMCREMGCSVTAAQTAEDIYACCKSTLIGYRAELTEENIEMICDQISRKATLSAERK